MKNFLVIAKPNPADDKQIESGGTVKVQIDDPNCRCTELELQPETTYSLSVETHFRGNIEPQMNKEDMQFCTQAYHEGHNIV